MTTLDITTAVRSTVRDLYDEYVALLDDGDFDAWLDLFCSDCSYLVVSAENDRRGLPLATMRCDSQAMLADRLSAIRNTQFFAPRSMRHFVGGVQILTMDTGAQPSAQSADSAVALAVLTVRANFFVTETVDQEPTVMHMAGRYRDNVVIEAERARFRSKTAVYDAAIVPTSLIFPL